MTDKQVIEIGTASIENIRKGVSVLKLAILKGKKNKPAVLIYYRSSQLKVGLYGETESSKAVHIPTETHVLEFTEDKYRYMSKTTGDVLKISKVIQTNAKAKVGKNQQPVELTSIPYEEYEDLLYNVGDFLEEDTSLNIVYNKGVGSFPAYEYIHKEDMVEAVRGELIKGKKLKGIQIMGVPRVTLYIQIKEYNQTMISFTYLGLRDNIYESFQWNAKDSLKEIVSQKVNDAQEYDRSLKESKLDKEDGGSKASKKRSSIMDMSDGDLAQHIEEY